MTDAVALVTGTSRGIGAAIASRLLEEGYTVAGTSRSGSPDLHGPGFHDIRLDLSDLEATSGLIESVEADCGPLDVLVNNAATNVYSPFWELPAQDFTDLVTLNLTVPFLLCQDAVRRWVARDTRGVVLNICSIESEVAWNDPPQAMYAATKGGLVGLTRALALDFGQLGIRVNGLAPGAIDSDMTPADDAITARIPLQNRLGRPGEIADAVAYLISDQASYVTGEIFYVDGGYRLL